MKNQLFTLAAVLTASAAMTSCSSEQLVENTLAQEAATAGKSHVVIINATKPGDESFTRAIAEEGSALKTYWAEGEKVYAYKGDTGGPVSYEVKTEDISGTGNKKATLKFNFTGTFAVDDQIVLYYQKEKDDYTDYSGQVGTLADIAEKYDRMKATVTVQAVNPNGEILSTTNADFVRQQAITKFTIKKKATTPAAFSIDPLSIKESTLGTLSVDPTSATSEIWVALPGRASSASPAEKTYKFETTADSKAYGLSKSVDLVNNQYYTATLTMGRDIEKITVTGLPTGAPATQPYSGGPVNITGASNGESETMTPSDDYTVTYKKNTGTESEPNWMDCNAEDTKTPGQYKAVITGNGDYEGTEEKIFSITKTLTTIVNEALETGTITAGSTVAQGTIDLFTSNILGLTPAQLEAGSPEAPTITIDSKNPYTDWASISSGKLVTTGGGIVTVTISLPETANHEAGSVTKTIYVKQSGIGGNVPDPGTAENLD